MNAKSLLFIFALLALFSVSSANVAEDISKRDYDDDEMLAETLALMQKFIKNKQEKEKQRITDSLNTKNVVISDEVKDEIPIDDEQVDVAGPEDDVEVEQPGDQNNEDIGPNIDEVEVITVTVEVEEGTEYYDIVTGADEVAAEAEVVEGENGENVEVDVIEGQPEINVDLGKNVVEAGIDVEDVEVEGDAEEEVVGSVSYDVKEEEMDIVNKDEETVYYEINEGEYDESDDTYNTVVSNVTNEDPDKKTGGSNILGASVCVLGAFGIVGALGYKYTQRKKRVLLPFHEDILEKGEFYDKNSAEQHIIPVWAAAKKEESEEEKEDEEKLFEVVYNYEPELPDELKLTVGDKIKIKEIYEDGWAYGYNKTTQLFGTFPSTSLGENFNPESVPQYKPEEVTVEVNDNMVEELKKKIVESN